MGPEVVLTDEADGAIYPNVEWADGGLAVGWELTPPHANRFALFTAAGARVGEQRDLGPGYWTVPFWTGARWAATAHDSQQGRAALWLDVLGGDPPVFFGQPPRPSNYRTQGVKTPGGFALLQRWSPGGLVPHVLELTFADEQGAPLWSRELRHEEEPKPKQFDAVWDGAAVAVAWRHGNDTPELWKYVAFARVTPGGETPVPPVRVGEIGPAGDGRTHIGPSLAWSGQAFALGWTTQGDGGARPRVQRLDLDGLPIGPPLDLPDRAAMLPTTDVTWAAELDAFLVVWATETRAGARVRLAVVGSDGALRLPPAWVSAPESVARAPRVAWTGSDALVVWEDARGEVSQLYFASARPGCD